jgi:hypothetical protein
VGTVRQPQTIAMTDGAARRSARLAISQAATVTATTAVRLCVIMRWIGG